MITLRWLAPAPADERALLSLLDAGERSRAARFHHDADRLAYAAAHGLLRRLLSDLAGRAPQAWRFVRTPTGKPCLDRTGGAPDLRFSLSHARGMVACAAAEDIELGVDVEPLAPVSDALILARAAFSAREAVGLQALTEPARSYAFTHLWTLKEAAHKAGGVGLKDRIGQPEFEPAEVADIEETPSPLHPCGWAFRSFRLPGPFVLSLARPEEHRSEPVCCRAADLVSQPSR